MKPLPSALRRVVTRFALCFVPVAGCASDDHAEPVAAAPSPAASAASEFTAMALTSPGADLPAIERVGGDMTATIERRGEGFAFQSMAITTPLPEGYPDPTPPGAIDLKRYPGVRRAEVSSVLNPDLGMNVTFFPLFWHIKDREIAMTSPVEMDYAGMERREGARPSSWTMSFLYRSPDLGPTGEDGIVEIVDREPLTVVSIGGRGSYSIARVDRSLQALYAWLDEHPEWEQAGEPRALYYNGPEKANRDKWYEVQVPVTPSGAN